MWFIARSGGNTRQAIASHLKQKTPKYRMNFARNLRSRLFNSFKKMKIIKRIPQSTNTTNTEIINHSQWYRQTMALLKIPSEMSLALHKGTPAFTRKFTSVSSSAVVQGFQLSSVNCSSRPLVPRFRSLIFCFRRLSTQHVFEFQVHELSEHPLTASRRRCFSVSFPNNVRLFQL